MWSARRVSIEISSTLGRRAGRAQPAARQVKSRSRVAAAIKPSSRVSKNIVTEVVTL